MRVLLLNPPYKKGFIRTARSTWMPISNSSWYPTYLAYTTGALEKKGHTVKLIDSCACDHFTAESVFEECRSFRPELLVLYTSSRTLQNDLDVADGIKKISGCTVIFVGPWCYGLSGTILKSKDIVDVVVPHEIEPPLLEIAAGMPFEKINGIHWQRDGQITENPNRDFMTQQDLDCLPFVTDVYRKHLNIRAYREASLFYPYVDLFAGRGCFWGKCTFCLWPQTMHKNGGYRTRSMENVLDEFKNIRKNMPYIKDIFFQDDALHPDFIRAFGEAVIKSNLKIAWSGYARPEMDYETLYLMKKSGCHCLHVGYESGSEFILRRIVKGVNTETMSRFTRDAKRAGIQIHADFLLGSPGETEKTLQETIDFARSLNLGVYQFLICDPYAGTVVDKQFKRLASSEPDSNGHSALSHAQLLDWKIKAYKSVYLRPETLYNALNSCKSWAEVRMFFWGGINLTRNVIFKTYE